MLACGKRHSTDTVAAGASCYGPRRLDRTRRTSAGARLPSLRSPRAGARQEAQRDTVAAFESFMGACLAADWARDKRALFDAALPDSALPAPAGQLVPGGYEPSYGPTPIRAPGAMPGAGLLQWIALMFAAVDRQAAVLISLRCSKLIALSFTKAARDRFRSCTAPRPATRRAQARAARRRGRRRGRRGPVGARAGLPGGRARAEPRAGRARGL